MIEEEKKGDFSEKVYNLIATDRYKEVLQLVYKMREEGEDFSASFLYEGLCHYEEKNDLKCLMCMKQFISEHPLHEKKDYPVFTSAICLINLGITETAVELLDSISKTYPDRERTLVEAQSELSQKLEAMHIAEEIKELIRG